jgi:choline transport protein
MYAVMHPDLIIQPWHTYVAYLLLTIVCGIFCIFCNHLIPKLQNFGLFLVVGGGLITIICLAALPKTHASTSSVFRDWENTTGWSGGTAFFIGCLNGAFTIGTPGKFSQILKDSLRHDAIS